MRCSNRSKGHPGKARELKASAKDKLLERAIWSLNQDWLVMAMHHRLRPNEADHLRTEREKLPSRSKKELERLVSRSTFRKGWRRSNQLVEHWSRSDRPYAECPHWLLRDMILPAQFMDPMTSLPYGALVELDFRGDQYTGGAPCYTIPQVTFYEDMVGHFNRATCLRPLVQKLKTRGRVMEPKDQAVHKEYAASIRAAAVLGVCCVEAYLNSIAFDHLMKHHGKLSRRRVNTLEDVNHLSTKTKIEEYPRIILDLDEPPITEDNCEAMCVVVRAGKEHRDATMHGGPHFFRGSAEELWREAESSGEGFISLTQPKMNQLYNVDLDDVARIVDAVVDLIRTINGTISGGKEAVHWLVEREEEGSFPMDALG